MLEVGYWVLGIGYRVSGIGDWGLESRRPSPIREGWPPISNRARRSNT